MKFNLLIVLACCAAMVSAKSVERCDIVLQNEFELAPMGMWENIQACAQSVVDALMALGAEVTESTNEAVKNVLKFKDLVMTCWNEPSKTAQLKCVVSNIREFTGTISQIMADATEIISVLKDQGVALIDAIKSCKLNDSATTFMEIATKMEKCY